MRPAPVHERRSVRLRVGLRAVVMLVAKPHGARGRAGLPRQSERGARSFTVVGLNALPRAGADSFFRRIAKSALVRRTDEAHGPTRLEHANQIGRLVEKRSV